MVSDKCCRLCLHDINLEKLSFQSGKIDELYKTIFDLFNIDIKETDFCRWICNTCYETTLKFREYKLKVAECQKIIENFEFLNKSMNSTNTSNDGPIGEISLKEFEHNSTSSSQLKDGKLESSEFEMSPRKLRSQKKISKLLTITRNAEALEDISLKKLQTNSTSSKQLKDETLQVSGFEILQRKLRSQKKELKRLTRSNAKLFKINSTKIKNKLKSNKKLPNTKKNEKKLKRLINCGKCKLKNISINLFKLGNNIDLKLLDEQQNPIEFNKLSYIEIEQLHESIIIPEIWSSFLNCFQNRKITRSTKEKLKVILNKSEYEELLD